MSYDVPPDYLERAYHWQLHESVAHFICPLCQRTRISSTLKPSSSPTLSYVSVRSPLSPRSAGASSPMKNCAHTASERRETNPHHSASSNPVGSSSTSSYFLNKILNPVPMSPPFPRPHGPGPDSRGNTPNGVTFPASFASLQRETLPPIRDIFEDELRAGLPPRPAEPVVPPPLLVPPVRPPTPYPTQKTCKPEGNDDDNGGEECIAVNEHEDEEDTADDAENADDDSYDGFSISSTDIDETAEALRRARNESSDEDCTAVGDREDEGHTADDAEDEDDDSYDGLSIASTDIDEAAEALRRARNESSEEDEDAYATAEDDDDQSYRSFSLSPGGVCEADDHEAFLVSRDPQGLKYLDFAKTPCIGYPFLYVFNPHNEEIMCQIRLCGRGKDERGGAIRCRKKFDNLDEFIEHFSQEHLYHTFQLLLGNDIDFPLECLWGYCRKQFRFSEITTHLMTHLPCEFFCSVCGGLFDEEESALEHLEVDEVIGQSRCKRASERECDARFDENELVWTLGRGEGCGSHAHALRVVGMTASF